MSKPEISRKLGCILVKGALPLTLMMELSDEAGKGAIIDGNAARMAKVDFAFGLPEDLNKLKEELAEEARWDVRERYGDCNLSDEALEWLATGEQGRSSLALFHAVFWLKAPSDLSSTDNHPHDPDDLNRILLLMEAVPGVREARGVMRSASPGWRAIIDHFDELEALFKEETSGQEQWHAPKTYDRMKEILKSVKNNSVYTVRLDPSR